MTILLRYKVIIVAVLALVHQQTASAQTNLLLNSGFEDINTCTEYNSECGVEGWFYLQDVKAQMLDKTDSTALFGQNSFGIFTNWRGFTGFSPVLGTLLPCSLQKGNQYIFRGLVAAKLNPKLIFKIGYTAAEKFYVPKRPFSNSIIPDTITSLQAVPNTNFYRFAISFTATGLEEYLTFGTFVQEDETNGKKNLSLPQTISLVLDNFELIAADKNEAACQSFSANKEIIYNYNYRHKEMDRSLYGKGMLAVQFPLNDSNNITQHKEPATLQQVADTLKLGDVFFDFNKANLKAEATTVLASYFLNKSRANTIDSIYIEGHTDSIGSDKRNLTLSLQRCDAVKNWLLLNSIATTETLLIHPFGKTKPIATNSTTAGRALNRRVELIVFRKKEK